MNKYCYSVSNDIQSDVEDYWYAICIQDLFLRILQMHCTSTSKPVCAYCNQSVKKCLLWKAGHQSVSHCRPFIGTAINITAYDARPFHTWQFCQYFWKPQVYCCSLICIVWAVNANLSRTNNQNRTHFSQFCYLRVQPLVCLRVRRLWAAVHIPLFVVKRPFSSSC